LSNSRECSSIEHCSDRIWSQQSIEKKPNDNLCQYCEYTIEKLRIIIEDNKTDVGNYLYKKEKKKTFYLIQINVEKWLSGACSMLPTKDAIDEVR